MYQLYKVDIIHPFGMMMQICITPVKSVVIKWDGGN